MKGGRQSGEAEVSEGGWSPGSLLGKGGLGWAFEFQEGGGGESEGSGNMPGEMELPNLRG